MTATTSDWSRFEQTRVHFGGKPPRLHPCRPHVPVSAPSSSLNFQTDNVVSTSLRTQILSVGRVLLESLRVRVSNILKHSPRCKQLLSSDPALGHGGFPVRYDSVRFFYALDQTSRPFQTMLHPLGALDLGRQQPFFSFSSNKLRRGASVGFCDVMAALQRPPTLRPQQEVCHVCFILYQGIRIVGCRWPSSAYHHGQTQKFPGQAFPLISSPKVQTNTTTSD